jgi:deoxyribose-phosphate aldolase
MSIRPSELAKTLEATLLRPNAALADVDALCAEAARRHLAAVAVLPIHVARAAERLRGTDVKVVALVSFPFGADVPSVKAAGAAAAAQDGADEVEVVMALSTFLSGDVNAVRDDLSQIVRTARLRTVSSGRRELQVRAVVETAYLDDRRIRLAARVLRAAEVDMAVTSTGLAPKSASPLDVELLQEELAGIAVKAAGGIRTVGEARSLLAAGASRLGCTDAPALLDQLGAA